MTSDDLAFASGFEIKKMILDKKISALELTDYFLERAEKLDPELHAFIYINREQVRDYAKQVDQSLEQWKQEKPLLGIPTVIPDVLHMRDTPTTFGSLAFKDAIYSDDEIEVTILKEAGTLILGKTTLAEFGLSYETDNPLSGRCVNPWNHDYSSGGGGSGAAVAVSAGLAPFALATDFNGALRMSSSFCGVLGLIPTRGRVPTIREHQLPYTELMFYRKGVIARNAVDIAMMLNVLAEPDPRDPMCVCDPSKDYLECVSYDDTRTFKIGYSSDLGFLPVDPEVKKTVEKGAKALEKLGHTVEEVTIPLNSDLLVHFQNLLAADRYVLIMKNIEENPEKFNLLSNDVKNWLKIGHDVTGAQYSIAIAYLGMLEDEINHHFEAYDFLLTPTMPTSPFPFGQAPQVIEGEEVKPYIGLSGFLLPFNMSGHPAITLPCGKSKKGLPIGMQLVAPQFSERRLITLTHQYLNENPWSIYQK